MCGCLAMYAFHTKCSRNISFFPSAFEAIFLLESPFFFFSLGKPLDTRSEGLTRTLADVMRAIFHEPPQERQEDIRSLHV